MLAAASSGVCVFAALLTETCLRTRSARARFEKNSRNTVAQIHTLY